MAKVKSIYTLFADDNILGGAKLRHIRAGLTASGYIEPYSRLDATSLAKILHCAGAIDGNFHDAMIFGNDRKLEATINKPSDLATTYLAKLIQTPAELAKVHVIAITKDANAILTVLFTDGTYKTFPKYSIQPANDLENRPAAIFTRGTLERFASILKPSARYETA
jgi:hypothetical protein